MAAAHGFGSHGKRRAVGEDRSLAGLQAGVDNE
jgi:hypothetical protein